MDTNRIEPLTASCSQCGQLVYTFPPGHRPSEATYAAATRVIASHLATSHNDDVSAIPAASYTREADRIVRALAEHRLRDEAFAAGIKALMEDE